MTEDNLTFGEDTRKRHASAIVALLSEAKKTAQMTGTTSGHPLLQNRELKTEIFGIS